MLAKSWDQDKHNPKGWLMSEKLDGVRCFWDGANMYSRAGHEFHPPKWFKNILPQNVALDGELWTKRDDWATSVSIVRKKVGDAEEWKQIFFVVYDAPLIDAKFSIRLKALHRGLLLSRQKLGRKLPMLGQLAKKHIVIHEQTAC